MSGFCTDGTAKRAAIYRAAAKRIEDRYEYACCYALHSCGGSRRDIDRMKDTFSIDISQRRFGGHWMAEIGEEVYGKSEEVQNRRILALCFMAAITERP